MSKLTDVYFKVCMIFISVILYCLSVLVFQSFRKVQRCLLKLQNNLIFINCSTCARGRPVYEPPRFLSASLAAQQLLKIVERRDVDKKSTAGGDQFIIFTAFQNTIKIEIPLLLLSVRGYVTSIHTNTYNKLLWLLLLFFFLDASVQKVILSYFLILFLIFLLHII